MKKLLVIIFLCIKITSFCQSTTDHFAAQKKHYALMELAQEYINKKDFKVAIACIDSAIKFPTFCKCGTCVHENYFNIKILYAACYNGQGDFKRTIDLLSPDMLDFEVKEELVEKLFESI